MAGTSAVTNAISMSIPVCIDEQRLQADIDGCTYRVLPCCANLARLRWSGTETALSFQLPAQCTMREAERGRRLDIRSAPMSGAVVAIAGRSGRCG